MSRRRAPNALWQVRVTGFRVRLHSASHAARMFEPSPGVRSSGAGESHAGRVYSS